MEKQRQEKRRKRKKKLLNSIREQIEFYFSDANLRHDRFMRQLVAAEDPELKGRQSVDLNQFMKFNKISEMTKKLRDITLSLESSKYLSLDSNQMTVKRIEPFVPKDTNFDDSTIYVERLPPNADQHWIRSVFGAFGQIEYIKIPHFRHNHNIMGFAFIEYSEPEDAQKALKHFSSLSSDDHNNESQVQTDPDLDLINTQTDAIPESDCPLKRSHGSDAEEVSEPKKIKTDNESNEKSEDKSETIEDKNETNTTIKKKKKRKRKRKTVTTPPTEELNESEVINLRVMSKQEWKRWKSKYLKLQKQTMSSIKRSLLVDEENKITDKTENESEKRDENCEDRHFESGLIIKLNFSMPSKDLNENDFKRKIRQIGGKNEIQYIDLPLNRLEFFGDQTVKGICFVRTNSREYTKRLVSNQTLKQLGDLTVLDGNEETLYWNQIFDQRIKKKSNNNETKVNKNRTKVRGFDRIINRAENVSTSVGTTPGTKPNKHIKFET